LKHLKPIRDDASKDGITRDEGKLRDGFSDKLEPLEALDLSKVETVNDLVKGMGKTAFAGRKVGEAADILHEMTNDKDCFVVATFSGAMTVAKMGLIICDMVDRGMIDAIVSTGALMAHGFIESVGLRHFKYSHHMDDTELYYKGYDRVYDTVELEKNLDDIEIIFNKVMDKVNSDEVLSSSKVCYYLGKYLAKNAEGRGILRQAYLKKIPVYIPAFTDSELGLDFALYNRRQIAKGEKPFAYNPFIDLEDFTERLKAQKKLGIFTVGGGVPRNWAQQVGPYLDIIDKRLGFGGGFRRFQYGIRICPEPVHFGGLSGATYSEGISWGKFVPENEGGRYAEVYADATIAWPLIVKAVMERMDKKAAYEKSNGKI